MLQQHVVFLVFQLRAVEPAAANPAVRSWQPQGPQLENGVFIVVRLHLSCCFSTKKNKESAVFVWKKRVRLRQKRMEEAGIFYVELCCRFILGKKLKRGCVKTNIRLLFVSF